MSSPKHSSTWPVSKTAAQARAEEQARYNFERAQVDADKRICHECGHECDPTAAPAAPHSPAIASATAEPAKAAQICDECSRNLEDGALYEDHSPRGTVKQGRRPMFKSFKQECEEQAAELERVKQQLADSEEAVQILAKGGAEYRQQRDELGRHSNSNAAAYDKKYDECESLRKINSELLEALKETLDALCNETAGKSDTPWVAGVKSLARRRIAGAEGGAQP